MLFSEIVAPTIRELFIEKLTGMILSGQLKIGQRLPSERELSEQLNVSKSIVHLGLEDMARMGFVTVVPRSGSYVADYVQSGNLETLNALLKHSGGALGRDIQLSMIEMRDAIEGKALIRLAAHHTPADIAELRSIVSDFAAAAVRGADNRELGNLLAALHSRICALSGNRLFPLILNAFHDSARLLWEACAEFRPKDVAVADNLRLIELISEGKGEEAAEFLSVNLANYMNNPLFLSSPETTFK